MELTIRPLASGEEPLFESMPDPGLVGLAAFGESYTAMAARGHYRAEWTWVALRGDRVLARAAWLPGPDGEPDVLDWFDFTEFEAGVALLRTAAIRAEYSIELPPDWRTDARVRAAAQARIEAARAVGMQVFVERHVYLWTPAHGLPERPGRLEFRPEPEDAVFEEFFARAAQDSLDAHTRRAVAASGPEAAARAELALLRTLPGPRSWWLVGCTREGEPVGFAIPARNPSGAVIGFVGVLPEHRGHGYAYELLTEATHLLTGHGAERIKAATDAGNTPMAAAFAKAGYPIERARLDLA